ncbi:NADPH:quinone reductase-like Zn-dependent oxidoreductase [Agromyces hippuratus]|uniref:NADPH:quinone reductase-like Zn-dependent oxidoreductase n=2 Tax=Agromyces hippuratus TaxID=286438 RepID=A0A852X3S1_9MICO|nr:NADP-dependent oxidoreductase [Agromyces hippuratus]NYG22144.1 NADPH:quinone reductase-like Zn-dependent oxidoreductase [Agromyces hippuratus]
MHAHLLTRYGPDGLEPGSVPERAPAPGEVAIRLDAIAVNPLDWKISHGWLAQMIPLALPAVIGSEGAGTVLSVGADVTDFAVGDRVAGFFDSGAFAEIAVTRATRLVRIPAGLSISQAAALPTAAETATRILGLLQPEAASTVVVNGAAGAVGSMVTQLLARDGHTVIGTAGAENHDYVRSLGASPIGYGPNLVSDLRRLAVAGIDAGYDTTGHGFIDRVADLVDARRIVTIADFAAGAGGAIVAGGDPTRLSITRAVRDVFDLAASGEIHVEIAATYPFEALNEALGFSEQGHLRGKVIVAGHDRKPADIGLA